jgi:preprotein translocase subunit SecA
MSTPDACSAGRRYSEGLHQALEAKERIEIKDENQTLGDNHAPKLLPSLRQILRHDRNSD